MPEPTHPPYAAGSLTIPRTLNRWLDKNPQNGPLTRTSTYFTLPAFAQADVWNGYSDIVASFNIEAPNNISLVNVPAPTSTNYVLCVSYRVGTVVTRYLLWNATGSNLNQTITPYTGQVLLKNFRFEVWNTSQGATSQATALTFYTSKLGQVDYRYGTDGVLAATDAINTTFDNLASATIPLPVNLLQYDFKTTSGFVLAGNTVTSWTDSVSGIVLTPVGSVLAQVIPNITETSMMSVTGSTLTGATLGANPGTTAIVFCLYDTNQTGGVYTNGAGGIVLTYDHATLKLKAYLDAVSNVSPTANVWYVAVMKPAIGTVLLYELQSGILVDTFYGSSSTGPDSAVTLGGTDVAITQVRVYNDELSSAEIDQLVTSLVQTYFSEYTIPLEFATTAVSTTN